MFKSIYINWLRKFGFSQKQGQSKRGNDQINTPDIYDRSIIEESVICGPQETTVKQLFNTHDPYDECLLEKAWTQWRFGEWESLAKLELDNIQHHPDRAKLALLVAAGHLQIGQGHAARQYIRLAQDWKCDSKLISRILISGVYYSLARVAAIMDHKNKAIELFDDSIDFICMGDDASMLVQARANNQFQQSKLLRDNALINNSVLKGARANNVSNTNNREHYLISSTDNAEMKRHLLLMHLETKKSALTKMRELLKQRYTLSVDFHNTYQPLVSIIVATKRPDQIDNIISNVARQRYEHKELIIIPHGFTSENISSLRKSIYTNQMHVESVSILELNDNLSLGSRLNKGIKSAKGSYWAKFDDDDIYLDNYLSDMMMQLIAGDYHVVGKGEQFVYCQDINKTILKRPGYSYLRTFVSGATLVVKRESSNELFFGDMAKGEDTALLRSAQARGMSIFAVDPFNHVLIRSGSMDMHTWKVSSDYFLGIGEIICAGIDLDLIKA